VCVCVCVCVPEKWLLRWKLPPIEYSAVWLFLNSFLFYLVGHDPAIIDNAVVEVAWSRPVNRTEYEARKELVRSISNGSLPGGPLPK